MLNIAIYVCPQTVCSSLSMANDAFVLANQLAGQALFKLQRFSLDGQSVDLGFASIRVDGDLSLAEQADLILLPATGSAIEQTLAANAGLLPWLAARAPNQQLASLCSSAFLLAAAGVLDGRHATTHWALANPFRQRFPQVQLEIDELLTHDGNLLCSGGAHAGLDLCLYLIGWHAGDWLAQRVAAALVFETQRGRQSRFAPLLPESDSSDSQLNPLLQWLQRHYAEPVDLQRLAERANCSPRTLLRRFRASTGLTPNDYLQRLRISAAQTALRHSSRSLEQIAAQVGYADRAAFAKLFKQLCGETPGAFRRRLRDKPVGANSFAAPNNNCLTTTPNP
ncbi:helix-turn-helix domain-containing protein [Pseudomonas cavernicola]|uniref:Helix-turn-helix domain-containing protein n=1 Tax=Pseudomonas cavernicola TaxID=2320866 RepID=A0A418XDQ2_9PSED|nr:helix-turn-helix domain-containing protein [Pseudomonas cavernicola]RJG10646.1 helix-turn-helix domain-containing protein [Pseudomonas cavernicola]